MTSQWIYFLTFFESHFICNFISCSLVTLESGPYFNLFHLVTSISFFPILCYTVLAVSVSVSSLQMSTSTSELIFCQCFVLKKISATLFYSFLPSINSLISKITKTKTFQSCFFHFLSFYNNFELYLILNYEDTYFNKTVSNLFKLVFIFLIWQSYVPPRTGVSFKLKDQSYCHSLCNYQSQSQFEIRSNFSFMVCFLKLCVFYNAPEICPQSFLFMKVRVSPSCPDMTWTCNPYASVYLNAWIT